jgi:hypothetical protein
MLEVYISYFIIENSIRIYHPLAKQSSKCKFEAQHRNLGHVGVVLRQREPTVGGDTKRIINSSRKFGDSSPAIGP